MGKLRFGLTMSLDGFVAGPDQSLEHPLGKGGMQLHGWALELDAWRRMQGLPGGVRNPSSEVVEASITNVGAYLLGRNMFGGGPGPWAPGPGGFAWRGWWGEDPPYHAPVFVLTHHARPPLVMQGGTTFTFVTDGLAAAHRQAVAAAAGKDVVIGGGASVVRQCLAAGLVDEVGVSLVPVFLGRGERLFEGLGEAGLKLVQVRAVEAPGVTHLRYRVER